MIKFEFVLTDDDAANLFAAVQSCIVQLHSKILDEKAGKHRTEYINAYTNLIFYYKDQKKKMHNTRIIS